jgi:hypothetical protein
MLHECPTDVVTLFLHFSTPCYKLVVVSLSRASLPCCLASPKFKLQSHAHCHLRLVCMFHSRNTIRQISLFALAHSFEFASEVKLDPALTHSATTGVCNTLDPFENLHSHVQIACRRRSGGLADRCMTRTKVRFDARCLLRLRTLLWPQPA